MSAASSTPRYPGIPAIVDGSEAIAHVETRLGKRGGAVVAANMAVIEAACDGLIDVTGAVLGHEAPEGTGSSAPAGELEGVLR